jgi:hypothetical protein
MTEGGAKEWPRLKIPCTDSLHDYSKLGSFVVTQVLILGVTLLKVTFSVELHAGFLVAGTSWKMSTIGGQVGIFLPRLDLEG